MTEVTPVPLKLEVSPIIDFAVLRPPTGVRAFSDIGLRAGRLWTARKDYRRGFQKKRGDGDCHAHGCRLIRRYFRGISRAHRRKMQKRTDRFVSLLML